MTARPHDAVAEQLETGPAKHGTVLSSERLCTPIPIQQIMVPLCGTPRSRHVLAYASAIAEATGAGISLVWVESPRDRLAGSVSEASPLDCLARIRTELGLRVPRVQMRVARGMNAVRGCVDAECTDGTDLVVLGVGSALDDAPQTLGELATEMIRRGQAPVLLIPPSAPPPPKSVRVLVLLDGSGRAELVLFPLIALANATMGRWIGEITLLTVCPTQEALADATAYLGVVRTSLERLVVPRIPIRTEPVLGRATSTLVGLANETATPRFEMLALTMHGQGYRGETLLGPVANQVLSRGRLLVLVVNPGRS